MDKPTLYPHNQAAYDAVMRHYAEGHRKAAVIQATGTGKSYVGGAVASHFSKVLIIAPNFFVLNQASSVTPHAECKTYAWLHKQDNMPTGYDLIWIDEFHRPGSKYWKPGVEKLIEANPDAKILGTTATPERWLEKRDMSEELFPGDVVSTLTLVDAWVKHILRVPKYIIGVIQIDDTHRDYTEKIKNSKRLTETQKIIASTKLNNVVRNWSYSSGVSKILAKHLDRRVKRMIVFAQTINSVYETRTNIQRWFKDAGIQLANVYYIHSAMGNEAERQMNAFEEDESDGVKVLICVNMLNEGIHVNRVDAVMMIRSTISKNLYMQQIGRCFAVGQEHQPIIFDLADNFTSACGYEGIYLARERYYNESIQREGDEEQFDEFEVIDTIAETRELINSLEDYVSAYDRRPVEIKIDDAADWCATNGRLPLCDSKVMDDKGRVERQVYWFMHRHQTDPQIAELFIKYRKFPRYTQAEMKELTIEWCKTNNRFPATTENDYLEHRIRAWLRKPENAELEKSLKEQYNYRSLNEKREMRFKEVIKFFETHGRRPKKGEKHHGSWCMILQEKGETYKYLYNKYIKPQEDALLSEKQRVIDFINKHHRKPSYGKLAGEEESEIGLLFRKFYNSNDILELARKYDKRKDVKKCYRERTLEKYKAWLKEFISAHGHLPSKSSVQEKEPKQWVSYYSRKLNRDAELNEIYSSTPDIIQFRKGRVSPELINFLVTERRIPQRKIEKNIYCMYVKHCNKQEVIDIVSTFK